MTKFTQSLANAVTPRFHYAWVVVGVIFLVLLCSAGIRATPSVMILPLEQEFGWNRSTISVVISVNIALYGLIGPFSAAAMQRFGIRRVVLAALVLLASGTALSTLMHMPWHMLLSWGLLVGAGTGVAANTLGATIVSRWFETRRGLAMGLLTASAATGQMVFLPLMAAMVGSYGWRSVAFLVSAVALLAIPLVWLLLPESPAAIGQKMLGQTSEIKDEGLSRRNPLFIALDALRTSVRMPDFWLLFASFFVCGLSTNGYIGTQFIAMCNDYGINEVSSASILAAMGMLDLVGTTLSGWLSDRYNPRVLLFWYYGLRGLALIFLPYAFGLQYYGLTIFAIFYGLDWIATVPPTVRLANDVFGRLAAPIVFGWIVAGHQLGAATATTLAGYLRASLGNYTLSSILMGVACLVGAVLVLRIKGKAGGAVAAVA
ncbi:MFS transporter [Herbaspirillum seropedicae]|jgi:predicted MFS family arabinose efflux permease|uniref:Permease of the major facilitator superfamily protein n=1 Tax=Herbaspirillum seropedicae (strain SmR1) TaxID=757424 RepID=D8J1P9_HERSS|nr:MFS transporter [Herbaspirillum seropedicae]ADJ62670.1 permease of the major facilitator superfamily protein [Herbaspirillum seropedicae SmR1]AKN64777.1 MFS transporter [Herbaspirillum seropedicae]MDR6396465.1 putative MFS family arabinose efflux permease [Herbaspirillum seropedicae]NQE31717.1 MFS transporter [Herbaspirillum seropedicae]QDD63644.1 MFS transporter [Herbaspirillum seropedicae]